MTEIASVSDWATTSILWPVSSCAWPGCFVLVPDIAARGSKDVAVVGTEPGLGRPIVLAAARSIDNLAVPVALGAFA
jgi:hypothetical protein